ncbi:hypothetical protein B0H15DRAFT_653899 [Mycena belliarum]|uniref:Uncharacterized protein n=1 Tax=Mycena belliarum TaxID=1033014 RepID=A0AAD6TQL4_9AGAR|nr:hypothetical protein B0H15DRAFT_653899 [Mycena belliae]
MMQCRAGRLEQPQESEKCLLSQSKRAAAATCPRARQTPNSACPGSRSRHLENAVRLPQPRATHAPPTLMAAHCSVSDLIYCDVLFYPADGGEPRIEQKILEEYKAMEAVDGLDEYTAVIFVLDVNHATAAADTLLARRSYAWGTESLDRDEEYVLCYSISPELPVNLAMARLVGADPENRSRRFLWRGDVFVVKRRKWPINHVQDGLFWFKGSISYSLGYYARTRRAHKEYVDMLAHSVELFNSRLIPEWYNSDRWLYLLYPEVKYQESCYESIHPVRLLFSYLASRKSKREILSDEWGKLIEAVILQTRLRDPDEAVTRDVLLFPVGGGKPRLAPMAFSKEGAEALPYGGLWTQHPDLRNRYGASNMFATYQKAWNVEHPDDDRDERYMLYHNISLRLPVNMSMARVVGADYRSPGLHQMWRGDVIVVRERQWPEPLTIGKGAHIDYADMPRTAIDLFKLDYIPNWYYSQTSKNFLEEAKKFNMWTHRFCSGPIIFRYFANNSKENARYSQLDQAIEELRAIGLFDSLFTLSQDHGQLILPSCNRGVLNGLRDLRGPRSASNTKKIILGFDTCTLFRTDRILCFPDPIQKVHLQIV